MFAQLSFGGNPLGRNVISDLGPATVSDLSVAGLRSINLEFHSFGCRLAQGSMVAT